MRVALPSDLDRLVALHMTAFQGHRAVRLGRAYVRAGHRWFLTTSRTVRLVAETDGTVTGFVQGMPRGLVGSMHRALRLPGVFGLLVRPQLLADAAFRNALQSRIRRLMTRSARRPVAEAPDHASDAAFVLMSIAVDPAFRGRGIAQMLMASFEAHALAMGFGVARLSVYKDNASAVRAYEKAGWRRVESADPFGIYFEKTLEGEQES